MLLPPAVCSVTNPNLFPGIILTFPLGLHKQRPKPLQYINNSATQLKPLASVVQLEAFYPFRHILAREKTALVR